MTNTEREYRTIRAAWESARERQQARGSDFDDAEEQRTYDELIDFVEAHGLNYTDRDPRGGTDA